MAQPPKNNRTEPPPVPHDPLFDDIKPVASGAKAREPGDDSDELADGIREPQKAAQTTNGKPAAKPAALVPQQETVSGSGVFTTASAISRRGPLGEETEYGAESVSVAAQVKAEIAALVYQARLSPRSFAAARAAILADCERPLFAKAAIYKKPQGWEKNEQTGKWEKVYVEGLSIRFAESALRHWGNIYSATTVLYDGPDKRRVKVAMLELETNEFLSREFVVMKTLEKKKLRKGQDAISQRINSDNEIVYAVPATEDELVTKEANYRSKFLRNDGLRFIPADIKEEALARCRKTTADKLAKDPDAEIKALADSYAALRISPERLAEYLGCDINVALPEQLAELQEFLPALEESDLTWTEVMEAKVNDLQGEAAGEEAKPAAVTSLKEKVKEKMAARKAAKR